MKKAILVVSFGTSYKDTFKKNIAVVEDRIRKEYGEYEVRRAFTSGMIIKSLAEKGFYVDDVPLALKKLEKDGYDEVYIAPTHIIAGDEYEKAAALSEEYKDRFKVLKTGRPLIYSTDDMERIISVLMKEINIDKESALVFMGHGTEHYVNPVYGALDYMFKEKGYVNVFVGAVEAYPSLDNVIGLVKKAGYKKAVLTPFMLVAGDHANNDMAGDENSWKSAFTENGIKTDVIMKGLGEYAGIQELYIKHIKMYLGI